MEAKKQQVRFDEETKTIEKATTEAEKNTRFKEKHSLDSDEEDETSKYDVLAEDDIEGQEESTIDFDDNIQITPFNMREEMEEGHFDSDGTYIFDKAKEIHDSWIDNIDWVKVKHRTPEEEEKSKKRPFQYSDDSDEESDEESKKVNSLEIYEEILTIVKEGETMAKAIRRLGKNRDKIPSASQKWKVKKLKATGKVPVEDEAAVEQARGEQVTMLRLTELCDELVQQGIMDIYEMLYERIAFTVKQIKEKEQASKLTIAEGTNDDDALDMFAEDFDSKEPKKIKTSSDETQDHTLKEHNITDNVQNPNSTYVPSGATIAPLAEASTSPSEAAASEDNSRVLWYYRKENVDSDELKGPFSTTQMISWTDDGTFGSGVYCRKHKSEGQFYSSDRIDFELYE